MSELKTEIKNIVLSYLASKRDAFLSGARLGETRSFNVTPHIISRYAEAEGLHTKPFCKPVQYKILKYLDFLRDEPWVCSADTVRIDVDLSDSGISKIQYQFVFRKNGEERRYDEEGVKHDTSSDVLNSDTVTSSQS